MKKILTIALLALIAATAQAQPKARRTQQAQQKQTEQKQQGGQQMTRRMQISYPTAFEMPEDVVWRRDIYREIDLNQGANAGLYYPVQPKGKQMNLFTYIFKLAQNGYIPIYEYSPTDSEERFEEANKRPFKEMLKDQGVFYEEKDGKVVIDNSDIPSEEVRRYFLKESAYYDQANSTFHRKVIALCPVRMSAFPQTAAEQKAQEGEDDEFSMGADFGDEPPRPMFWVKYSDLEPFLSRQSIIINDNNIAATVTMQEFFTLNKYNGNIYKTTNMLGRNLADYCKTDSALKKEQARIEAELQAFRKGIFGSSLTSTKKDSTTSVALDSLQKVNPKEARRLAREKEKADREAARAAAKASKESASEARAARKRSSSTPSSSSGRVSVRRQRH